MIYKILGLLIILSSGVIAYMTLQKDIQVCEQMTPAQQLKKLIQDDFQNLAKTGLLPKQWSSIKSVEVHMNSQLAKALLSDQLPEFKEVKEGISSLELEYLDLPDEERPGFIIQASLFDVKTRNKVFEIGRTYLMRDLNKAGK